MRGRADLVKLLVRECNSFTPSSEYLIYKCGSRDSQHRVKRALLLEESQQELRILVATCLMADMVDGR
jgi:hypothetical protein